MTVKTLTIEELKEIINIEYINPTENEYFNSGLKLYNSLTNGNISGYFRRSTEYDNEYEKIEIYNLNNDIKSRDIKK